MKNYFGGFVADLYISTLEFLAGLKSCRSEGHVSSPTVLSPWSLFCLLTTQMQNPLSQNYVYITGRLTQWGWLGGSLCWKLNQNPKQKYVLSETQIYQLRHALELRLYCFVFDIVLLHCFPVQFCDSLSNSRTQPRSPS